ncbi:MAG: 3-dehydroquinate synthase family protein [Pseudobdellovibrio sp.]
MKSKNLNTVSFKKKMPARNLFPSESVLIYDLFLASKPDFKKWSSKFKYQISVQAGESLKSLSSLQLIIKKISDLKVPQTTQLTFIAVGGGSVGDFVGFLASIFLRGRIFVQMPSTWLAAIDSAHGGKNALNFKSLKNQIGTIYPAEKIYIIEELLKAQPQERFFEALGEVVKISIINSASTFETIAKNTNKLTEKDLFKLLPELIQAKMKIVKKDPTEIKGSRRILNLGHTMGHVFESHFKIAHGEAVLLGVLFSARWSFYTGLLKESDFVKISNLVFSIKSKNKLDDLLKKITNKQIQTILIKDKKIISTGVMDFIFIKRIGHVSRLSISIAKILDEVQRQKMEF